jgi:co-chaperonin GroES (HSP10)
MTASSEIPRFKEPEKKSSSSSRDRELSLAASAAKLQAPVEEEEVARPTVDPVTGADNLAAAYAEKPRLNPDSIGKTLLDRMPNPTGWRILILPYRGKEKTTGGIFIPTETSEKNHISTQVGYVLKVGPLAYKDTTKFPSGAWCEEKQWVIFARYAGSRFQIDGGEVRILNDDEVLSTILDPEDIHQLN